MMKTKCLAPLAFACFFIGSYSFAQSSKSVKTIIVDAGHGGKDFGAHGAYEGGLGSYEKNVTLAISLKLVAELKKQLPDVKVIPTRTTDIYQSPPEKANIANDNKGDLFVCIHADAVALQTGRRQISTRVETRYKYTYEGKGKKKKKIAHPYSTVVPVYEYYKLPSRRSGTSVWLFAAHKTSDKIKALMQNEEEIQIESDTDSLYNSIDFSAPEYRMMAKVHADRYQKKSIKLAELVNEEISTTNREALGINQRQKGIWVLQATNMPAILVETGFITNYDDERYLNSEKGQQEIAECIARAIKRYKEELEGGKPVSNSSSDTNKNTSSEERKVLEEATGKKQSPRL
jgi:N-acetylmuramoyl-L-alanine amidase